MPDTQRAMVYIRYVLGDEYVQEQLRNAATGLRDAYDRTRRKRAQVTEDKRLYANLRQAATSIRNAATALQTKPEPEPQRRRRGKGKVGVLVLTVGGTAWLAMRMQKVARESDRSAGEQTTSAASDGFAPPSAPPGADMTPGPATATDQIATPDQAITPDQTPGTSATFPA